MITCCVRYDNLDSRYFTSENCVFDVHRVKIAGLLLLTSFNITHSYGLSNIYNVDRKKYRCRAVFISVNLVFECSPDQTSVILIFNCIFWSISVNILAFSFKIWLLIDKYTIEKLRIVLFYLDEHYYYGNFHRVKWWNSATKLLLHVNVSMSKKIIFKLLIIYLHVIFQFVSSIYYNRLKWNRIGFFRGKIRLSNKLWNSMLGFRKLSYMIHGVPKYIKIVLEVMGFAFEFQLGNWGRNIDYYLL